jgi:3-deoxy-D-manno-octulosonate 8-phosphate phosphatase (KDO 8-P phosphatase)
MNVLELFKTINTFVFDVDGVLTDGTLLVLPNGVMARRMNIKDGYALQLAVKKGYNVLIISGGDSPEVKERLHKLGVTNVFMKVQDKVEVLKNYMQQHKLTKEQVLFMGDDMPDAPALRLVGLPCCPNDAATDIKEIAKYISPLQGGTGCARDVIEKVMKLQHNWNEDITVRAQ